MNRLINFAFALLSVLLFSSCNIYQIVSLSGDLPMNDKFQFYSENGDVKVVYSFDGKGGPIHLDLYNKTDHPLYIDWSKCALVINDQSFTLWNDDAFINGKALEFKVNPNNTVRSISSFEGTISKQEKLSFIPPQTKIVRDSYEVCPSIINNKGRSYQKIKLYTDKSEYNEYRAKRYEYNRDNTPLAFSIYLMISDNEAMNNPIQLNSKFWAADLVDTSVSSSIIFMGNQFFNTRTN
jgi:hypothetical protein